MATIKDRIRALIERGYSNREIVEKTGCNRRYVDKIREEYRDMDPAKYAGVMSSRPPAGTNARKIFECIYWNPSSTNSEIANALNAANPDLKIKTCQVNAVRKRYMPRNEVRNEQ